MSLARKLDRIEKHQRFYLLDDLNEELAAEALSRQLWELFLGDRGRRG